MRLLCPVCTSRPVAINRHIGEKTYYRKVCDRCSKAGKKHRVVPLWALRGYKKKPQCEKCGFLADMPDKQLQVFHVDGNLKNVDWVNLKTICLNCQPVVYKSRLPWKPAGPVPGF